MTYVDARYISMARESEVKHHERTMDQLRAKIAQLTKAVAWELEQHQSRLKELQQVETTYLTNTSHPILGKPVNSTLDPVPSSKRRWTKSRKYIHRSAQKPVAQLVG